MQQVDFSHINVYTATKDACVSNSIIGILIIVNQTVSLFLHKRRCNSHFEQRSQSKLV